MADSEKSSSGENEQKNETITESSDEQATAMEVEGDPKELKIIHVFEHAAEKCIDKCLNASKMARFVDLSDFGPKCLGSKFRYVLHFGPAQ